jgi:ribosomal protein L40E
MQSGYIDKSGVPEPGWSDRVDNPEIKAGMKKMRSATIKFGIVTVLLALAIPPILAHFEVGGLTKEFGVKLGIVIAGSIIVCSLLGALFQSLKKPYEGVVIDKREELKFTRDRDGKKSSPETEYITYVELAGGGRKKIKDHWTPGPSAWKYLKVGERFRYHPRFAFPYELYDKSKAEQLFCPVCSTGNPVEADRCRRCHAPLLK